MLKSLLRKFSVAVTILFMANTSMAQLYEVKMEEKLANSNLVIEGKVLSQHSFWNEKHSMIYTTNKVEVYKIFKGTVSSSSIEIMTQGGNVNGEAISASDLLELSTGYVGVFFCFPNSINLRSPLTNEKLWDVYSSSQGFFNYDLDNEKASAPFVRYQSISNELYTELATKIGHGFENRKASFDVANQKPVTTANRTLFPVVVSFSPASVNAGALSDPTNNVLTITGTGFGASFTGSAAILFDDGNDGTGGTPYAVAASDPYLTTLIVSWTDTEIKVRVPSRVGTGYFTVRDASGVTSSSLTPLNVFYSILNTNFLLGGTYYVKQSNLMNDDGVGGYTILYSISAAGGGVDITSSPAQATFQRALNTWKDIAGFNVTEGGSTASQQVNPGDGSNTIMFDNTNTGNAPLASGVLAVCYSFTSICSDNPLFYGARKTEFDIVIRNTGVSVGSTSFTFGPCPPVSTNFSQIDLESVVFHELGHALNLAHINDAAQYTSFTPGQVNPSKLMNYAVYNGTKRASPDNSAKSGALYTCTPHGFSYGSCFPFNNEMTQLTPIVEAKDNCPLVFPSTPTAKNTSVAFDMVHTSSNTLVDPAYTQVNCDGTNTAVTNNAFYAIKTTYSGKLSLTISGYTTAPTALAACTSAYSGVLATGFRLSLYQVSSCPTGQAFPTPVACRTFSSDGAIFDITGLVANTNYLIFIESIESTKATFNMLIGGTALPIKLVSFTGEVAGTYNNLNWVAESVINITKLVVERSSNGISFESIGEITGADAYNRIGNFKDFKPSIGNNFYRLKIVNNNGSIEYSNVVILKRSDKFLFTISPNPAVGFAEVQISSEDKGNYTIVLHNNNGQQVLTKNISVNSGIATTRLDLSTLAKGIYSVSVYDRAQTKVRTMLLSVQ